MKIWAVIFHLFLAPHFQSGGRNIFLSHRRGNTVQLVRLGHYWFGSRTNPPVLLILQMAKATWGAGFVRRCARNDGLISTDWE